jgi:hypothetical protein
MRDIPSVLSNASALAWACEALTFDVAPKMLVLIGRTLLEASGWKPLESWLVG